MTTNGNTPVILSAVRTPIGKMLGALAPHSATDLGALVVREAAGRANTGEAPIDEVILGQVVQAGAGQAPARQAAIGAGLPGTTSALTVNKVCGSGLKAVMLGAGAIRAGDARLIVAGGMESMTHAPHLVREVRGGRKYGDVHLEDANRVDGLWCSIEEWAMGDAAEFIAEEFEVTREQMDDLALRSHQRAVAAQESGAFEAEILPVTVRTRRGEHTVTADEGPRPDTSAEALAGLRPAFRPDGRVTAGNAPGLNDGAAALVLASAAHAEELGAEPLARVVGYAQAAVDPKYIFAAPAKALPRLLDKVGWTMDDVDLIELNEAFAAQVLANVRELEANGHRWDWDRVNVNGGAIALGHPIGASGARILVTLVHALRARGLERGIAALCLGGGEAVAMAVEIA
ncbi:MAG: acetyl-CoA C-acyltransferase [Chloroflexi bacterium]|nr:acetyl-CoA C-acyltransferase [Chloroflexota bacterium]